jgi:hypothetical protein
MSCDLKTELEIYNRNQLIQQELKIQAHHRAFPNLFPPVYPAYFIYTSFSTPLSFIAYNMFEKS